VRDASAAAAGHEPRVSSAHVARGAGPRSSLRLSSRIHRRDRCGVPGQRLGTRERGRKGAEGHPLAWPVGEVREWHEQLSTALVGRDPDKRASQCVARSGDVPDLRSGRHRHGLGSGCRSRRILRFAVRALLARTGLRRRPRRRCRAGARGSHRAFAPAGGCHLTVVCLGGVAADLGVRCHSVCDHRAHLGTAWRRGSFLERLGWSCAVRIVGQQFRGTQVRAHGR
jgi:hypothetical protein